MTEHTLTTSDNPVERSGRPESLSVIAWVFFCVAVVAPALVVDSVPMGGLPGVFAAGGRYALRVAALGVPLAISLVCWSLDVLRRRRIRYTPFVLALPVLALLAILSTLFAVDRRIALFGLWIDEQGLVVWLLYLIAAFLGSQLVKSRARLTSLTLTVVGAAALVGAVGLLEVIGMRPFPIPAEEWAYSRGVSTMMNPDFLGNFMVVPAILSVGAVFGTRGRTRVASVLLSAITLSSVVLTLTRGAWAGVAVGLLSFAVMVLMMRRREGAAASHSPRSGTPWAIGAAVMGTSAVAVLGLAAVAGRVRETLAAGGLDAMLSGRLSIWSEIVPAIAARPVLGAGPANILYGWQQFAGTATIRQGGVNTIIDSAHNVLLDLAVQFGIPFAAVAIVSTAWLTVRVVRKGIAGEAADDSRFLQAAWASSGIGMAVAFITGITTVPILAIASALVGVLLSLDARGYVDLKESRARIVTAAAVVIALAFGLFSAMTGWSALAGNQAAPSLPVRAQRDMAALRIAPWRMLPSRDLLQVAQAMSQGEQGATGITVGFALEEMLRRDPRNAITQYTAGDLALRMANDPQGALANAERALKLRPVFAGGLMLKGDALVALGRIEEGLRFQKQAVTLEEQAPVPHAFEAPWTSYMSSLIAQADRDPSAIQTAEDVLARYRDRFPQSPDANAFSERLSELQAR